MGKSNIEWTGHTWNPLAGCSVLTPGCKRCYAMKMAARLEAMGQPLYAGLTVPSNAGPVWSGVMRQASDAVLLAPLHRQKPTMYFVNSMSDLCHEKVPDEWIFRIFAVMALTQRHTYQVLTKRSARLREVIERIGKSIEVLERHARSFGYTLKFEGHGMVAWPLPNVWLGVSTERQQEADARIPDLLHTAAAVRFISAEPLLGHIHLGYIGWPGKEVVRRTGHNALVGARYEDGKMVERLPRLDWVIVGGESGHGYRPMDPAWAYSLRDQCVAAGVPVFIKQMAGKKPIPPDLLRREFPVAA